MSRGTGIPKRDDQSACLPPNRSWGALADQRVRLLFVQPSKALSERLGQSSPAHQCRDSRVYDRAELQVTAALAQLASACIRVPTEGPSLVSVQDAAYVCSVIQQVHDEIRPGLASPQRSYLVGRMPLRSWMVDDAKNC